MPKPKPNPSTPTPAEPAAPAVPPKATADDRPPLPPGWVWTTIGDVTSPVEKVDPREQPDFEFVYLDISSIDNHAHRIVSPKRYRGREAPSRARQLVRKHDVLFSTVRVYLRNIALVPPQYDGQIASTGFAVLRGNQAIEPKYLFFYTLTDDFIERLNHLQRGTSYPAVRDRDVRAQSIPLAPLPEQRRIVAKIEERFSQLDAAEEGLRRVQRNLKRYRAAVLKAAVEGRLVPRGRGDPADRPHETGAELLQRILAERRRKWEEQEWAKLVEKAKKKAAQARRKAQGRPARLKDIPPEEWQAIPEEEYRRYLPKDDRWKQKYKEPTPPDTANLPPLPEGWAWATVEMISETVGGVTKGRRLLGRKTIQVPYLRVANVQRGFLDLKVVKVIEIPEEELGKYALQKYDVLLTEGGDWDKLGRAAVWHEQIKPCIHQNHIFRARPFLFKEMLGQWIAYVANSEFGQRYFTNAAKQTTNLASINLTQLRACPIPLPPLAEQRRIVVEVERRLSVAQEAEKAVEANLKRIARLRQAILKRAFEGRLV